MLLETSVSKNKQECVHEFVFNFYFISISSCIHIACFNILVSLSIRLSIFILKYMYSGLSLSRTCKGTKEFVGDKEKFEIEGVRDRENQLYI